MLVEPDVFRRLAFGKEQQVGFNAGVRVKHTVRQAHDGVQVALLGEQLFDLGFHTFAKQRTVRQHHRRTAVFRQHFNNQLQKQIRRLASLHLCREVLLDAVFFGAAERRVGDDHIQLFIPRRQRLVEGVVVTDLHRHFDAV